MNGCSPNKSGEEQSLEPFFLSSGRRSTESSLEAQLKIVYDNRCENELKHANWAMDNQINCDIYGWFGVTSRTASRMIHIKPCLVKTIKPNEELKWRQKTATFQLIKMWICVSSSTLFWMKRVGGRQFMSQYYWFQFLEYLWPTISKK